MKHLAQPAGSNARLVVLLLNLSLVESFRLVPGLHSAPLKFAHIGTVSTRTTSPAAALMLAGIVVGGTSILGGEGAVWRTVLGILFIAMLYNGFTLLKIDPLFQGIALGAIILLAVGFDAWSRLRRR